AGGEVTDVDDGELGLAAVGQEASLGQPSVERHLAALEPRPDAAAGPRLLALVALARRLAVAGARAAADPLALLGRSRRRPQILDSHDFASLRSAFFFDPLARRAFGSPGPAAATPCPSSTATANTTWLIMPRMVGVSSCSTTWRMWRRPSACTVPSCFGESPMMLFTRVTLSFFARGRLLPVAFHGPPPRRVGGLQPLQPPEGIHRRLQHVVRVVGAECLGEDVLHPRRLQHRSHRPARDDP